MLTIDMRCNCAKCVSRTQNIYRMVGACLNCGAEPILMLFRAGDTTARGNCPKCECHTVMVKRLATDDEIPEAA